MGAGRQRWPPIGRRRTRPDAALGLGHRHDAGPGRAVGSCPALCDLAALRKRSQSVRSQSLHPDATIGMRQCMLTLMRGAHNSPLVADPYGISTGQFAFHLLPG